MMKKKFGIKCVVWPLILCVLYLSSSGSAQEVVGTYEAEDAAILSNVYLLQYNNGYNGEGYADFQGYGSHMSWNIQVATTGNYKISVRYSSSSTRPLDMLVDEVKQGSFAFMATIRWNVWYTETFSLSLTEGDHRVKLLATQSSGPNIDRMTLEFYGRPPLIEVDDTDDTDIVYYQPEDAKSNRVAIKDNNRGYEDDNGFADYQGNGAYLLWTVQAPITATYEITVRYSAKNARPAFLVIDGNEVDEFEFAETDSWHEWDTETKMVFLSQGSRSLMILADESAGPNIDWMSVLPDSASAPVTAQLTMAPASLPPTVAPVTPVPFSIPTLPPISLTHVPSDTPSEVPSEVPVSPNPTRATKAPTMSQPTGLPPSDFDRVVVLESNSRLNRGEFVVSPSGDYKVGLTNGGNFVLQDKNSATIWSSGTNDGYRLYMQSDGNLILRTSSGSSGWKSQTYNNRGARFVLDDGGQITVVSSIHGAAVWLDGVPRGKYTGPSSADLTYPLRGTFYYPWYPETWTVGGQIAHFQPSIGYYSSSDPFVVESHLDSLDYAHVDVSIASWWGIETNLDRARLLLRMDKTIETGSNLKWTIYYEDEMKHDPSVAELRADLDYLKKWFAWHPAWAHIDGKPVIFIWNESDCEVVKRWMEASDDEWYVVTKLFGNYWNCAKQPDHWHQYGVGDGTLEYSGVSFTIGPGFWRADKAQPDKPRMSEAQWCDNVEEMVDSGQPWQLIVSFNEAGEGTMVESSPSWASNTKYGFYLDCLHDYH